MARFYLLSGHLLCEASVEDYSAHQNTEQLNKTLISLRMAYRDLSREQGVGFPHEAEFAAYNVLLHLGQVHRPAFGASAAAQPTACGGWFGCL